MTVSDSTARKTATLLVEGFGQLDPRQITQNCTIGRDPRSVVTIDHPTVSRAHAEILYTEQGWIFRDLGSQNGSAINGMRVAGQVPLSEGAELHIGRVRAWFFAKEVPTSWRPDDSPQLAGKLVRCRCGHIGWAPGYAAGMRLTCVACGRDIIVSGNDTPAASSKPAALDTCAACHTDILTTDSIHACPDCAATMHAGCWNDNRGCATYGCAQVNVLDNPDDPAPTATAEVPVAAVSLPTTTRPIATAHSRGWRQPLIEVLIATVIGLLLFGVPGIAFGAYRLVAGDVHEEGQSRYVWIALSFAAGVFGFSFSFYWWFER